MAGMITNPTATASMRSAAMLSGIGPLFRAESVDAHRMWRAEGPRVMAGAAGRGARCRSTSARSPPTACVARLGASS